MERFEDFVKGLQMTEAFKDVTNRLSKEIANRYDILVSKAKKGTLFKENRYIYQDAVDFFSSSLNLSEFRGEVVKNAIFVVRSCIEDTISMEDYLGYESAPLKMDNYEAAIVHCCLVSDGFWFDEVYNGEDSYKWYLVSEHLSGVLREYFDLCRELYDRVGHWCDEFLKGREFHIDGGYTIPADNPIFFSYRVYLKHLLFCIALRVCRLGGRKYFYEYLTMDANPHFIHRHIAKYLAPEMGLFIKPISTRGDYEYAGVFEDKGIDEHAVFTPDTLSLTPEDCEEVLLESDLLECYLVAIGFTSKDELRDYIKDKKRG